MTTDDLGRPFANLEADFAVVLGADADRPGFADFSWARKAPFPPLKTDYHVATMTDLLANREAYFRDYRPSPAPGARRKLFPKGDLFLEEGGLRLTSGGETLIDACVYDFFNVPYVGWKTVFDLDTGIAADSAAGLHIRFAKFRDAMHVFYTEPVSGCESHWTFPEAVFTEALRGAYDRAHAFLEAEAEFLGLPTRLTPDLIRGARFTRLMEGLYVLKTEVVDGGPEGPILDLPRVETKIPLKEFRFGGFLQGADVGHFNWGVKTCDVVTWVHGSRELHIYLDSPA